LKKIGKIIFKDTKIDQSGRLDGEEISPKE